MAWLCISMCVCDVCGVSYMYETVVYGLFICMFLHVGNTV